LSYEVAYLIVFSEPETVDSFCESVKQFRSETITFQAPETKHRTGQKTQSSRPLFLSYNFAAFLPQIAAKPLANRKWRRYTRLAMLIEHLQKTFAERSRKNPAYSLRTFARALEIDSSTLSALLKGKRPLTAKTAQKLIAALHIEDPREAQRLLLGSIEAPELKTPAYTVLEMEAAEVISSWEHFAILALLELEDFRGELRTISSRLNIPTGVALDCLTRLEKLGLVEKKLGRWRLTGRNMSTPTNVPSASLREANRQCIQKALESMEKDPVESRDITGITMAIDAAKIFEAQREIREFRRKLAGFLESGTRNAVYRLNIQLFPLSLQESKK
jgi:transcriptional regulator with XRE-family HTH domain